MKFSARHEIIFQQHSPKVRIIAFQQHIQVDMEGENKVEGHEALYNITIVSYHACCNFVEHYTSDIQWK